MLREGALASCTEGFTDGFVLRISLPWIRSLPLSSIIDLSLTLDGAPEPGVQVMLGDRSLGIVELVHETGWWHLQDHLALRAPRALSGGTHVVELDLILQIPHLSRGPDAPLELSLHEERTLMLDAPPLPSISRDAGDRGNDA